MNVLVVVDMQNDFIDAALGTKEAVSIVPAVLEEIHDPRYDVVMATLDTHGSDYMQSLEGKYLPVEHCIKGSYGWELNSDVKKALEKRNAVIIEKPTFGSQALLEKVTALRPDTVTLIGLCTDICVVSNAVLIKTALYDHDVFVKETATAGVTEEKKQAALEVMRSCQIQII